MTARVYTHGKRLALGASTTAIHWIGEACLFALGDGRIVIQDKEKTTAEGHDGAILCAAPHPEGAALLTGGDDGRLALTRADGATEEFAKLGRKWIDHVAASAASGLIVAAQGKEAAVFKAGARTVSHRFAYPSSIGGLAMDGKGRKLAASHYGGATVRYALMDDDAGVKLSWAGSHLAITFAADGDYLVTAMQESELHGWRLPDKTDLRMTGYPAKTRSFSWDKRGRYLASSGAHCAVVWPFSGKLGPQGKAPVLVGERPELVTCVAFHPREDILALGYGDGAVRCERIEDRAYMLEIDEPGEGPVTALAWRGDGAMLAIGDDAGRGAIVAV